MIFKDQPGVSFEGGIALGLNGVNRNFPTVLAGDHRFIIPVGSLNQAYGNRQLM